MGSRYKKFPKNYLLLDKQSQTDKTIVVPRYRYIDQIKWSLSNRFRSTAKTRTISRRTRNKEWGEETNLPPSSILAQFDCSRRLRFHRLLNTYMNNDPLDNFCTFFVTGRLCPFTRLFTHQERPLPAKTTL